MASNDSIDVNECTFDMNRKFVSAERNVAQSTAWQPNCLKCLQMEGKVEVLLELLRTENPLHQSSHKEDEVVIIKDGTLLERLQNELNEAGNKVENEYVKNVELQKHIDRGEREKCALNETIESVSADVITLKETIVQLEEQLTSEQTKKDEQIKELEEDLKIVRHSNSILKHRASHLQADLRYIINLLQHKDIIVLPNVKGRTSVQFKKKTL